MARHILANHDEMVGQWVAARIPGFEFDPNGYTALGLADGQGNMLAGAIYECYTRDIDVRMHVAAVPGRRWLCREFIGEGFRYPFIQLNCQRVTGLVPADNEMAAAFDEHLGFTFEGRMRRMMKGGADLLIYGMLKEECRWLNVGVKHGLQHNFAPRRFRAA